MANAMVITSTFTYTACEFPTSVAKIFSITRCFYIMLTELRSWDMLTCQGQNHKLPLDVSWMLHNLVDLLWEASFMKQVKYSPKYLLSWNTSPSLKVVSCFHLSCSALCRWSCHSSPSVSWPVLSRWEYLEADNSYLDLSTGWRRYRHRRWWATQQQAQEEEEQGENIPGSSLKASFPGLCVRHAVYPNSVVFLRSLHHRHRL